MSLILGTLAQHLAGIITNDIQVSGLPNQEFPESRWREAIQFYLFGIWSDRKNVTYRPKISFGGITLRLDPEDGIYFAYGTPYEELPTPYPFHTEDELSVYGGKQAEVEIALIRFVKNYRIKVLELWLPRSEGTLVLWKKPQRSQYGCTGSGLPKAWSLQGPVR